MTPAASRDEIVELIGDVDESFVARVSDTGASIDEIAEAIGDLEGRFADTKYIPSSTAVAEVRMILQELAGNEHPHTFPIRGEPLLHP